MPIAIPKYDQHFVGGENLQTDSLSQRRRGCERLWTPRYANIAVDVFRRDPQSHSTWQDIIDRRGFDIRILPRPVRIKYILPVMLDDSSKKKEGIGRVSS